MPRKVDLTSCDREPIHIPGSIQPCGCLLACDAQAVRITRISENAGAFFGRETPRVGELLADYFGETEAHALRNALAQSSDPKRPALIFGWRDGLTGRTFDISLHRHDGTSIVEFEPAAADQADNPLRLTRQIIARTKELKSLEEMAARVPRYLQAMLGYHRVMMYRFADDGSGKVIGEAKRSDLELSRSALSGVGHPAAGAAAVLEERDPRDLGFARHQQPDRARARRLRRRARSVVRAPAQRLAHPSRISAEHGRQRLDVAVDHH